MTDIRALIRRQQDLEEEATSLGAVRYRQNRPLPWKTETGSVEEEANLPPGQQLIKQAVVPTAELIREKLEAAATGKAGRRLSALKWLEEASPEEAAYIAARATVNAAVERSSLQTVAIKTGNLVIDHVEMLLFAGKNKAGYVGLVRANHKRGRSSAKRRAALRKLLENEGARVRISQREKLHLGVFLIETLIEATGFFQIERAPNGKRTGEGYILRPTEAVETWLEKQHARCELLSPVNMPMVLKPRKWSSPFRGGYLSRTPGTALVRGHGSRGSRGSLSDNYLDQLKDRNLDLVYEAVNHVQETAWAINKPVLEVMKTVWDQGGSLGGLPPREDAPLPPKPINIQEDEEALARWKRDAALIHQENAKGRAKRLGIQQRLWLATRFADEEAIYFPHSLDFRGRMYPIPNAGFSPQDDDNGKALLRFAEGKPIGRAGAYWLAVHIANLFGIDKVSFKERVEWTYDHSEKLIDSGVNPLDGQRFWTEADSPWMALAAVMEFVGYLEEGEGYVSHLPIPLDGSNSGLQHFSAMLRDPVGAAAVNLIPSPTPQDLYTQVAEAAQAIADTDEDPGAEPWRGGKVTRKIAKRPTMTFVYSATRFGMQDMVLQTLRELDQDNAERGLPPHLEGHDNHAAANYLSHVLYAAIGEVVAAASEAMAWLRDVARVAADAGVHLEWTTADGFSTRQSYRNGLGQRVKVHWQGSPIYLTLATEGSSMNVRGSINGVAPNYVHSMDAAHLRAVARAAKREGIDSLAVIHDSFGTHAADTDKLRELLRDTFVEQYEPDVLMALYDEVRAQLPEAWASEVPPPPAKGALDLSKVRQSAYLFA